MTSQVLRALDRKGSSSVRSTRPTPGPSGCASPTPAPKAPRASAAVEQADAQFFRPVAVGDAVALLGRLARPETGDPPAGPE
ncbi:hypothetical protein ACFCYC_01570 [Streptomyces sp. NPDC056402]|uniref:hypothetical protein n=1 Tax=Streptomyces sp. NPDC056402 TaxID=3345810 RepID=UPI0035D6BCC6